MSRKQKASDYIAITRSWVQIPVGPDFFLDMSLSLSLYSYINTSEERDTCPENKKDLTI